MILRDTNDNIILFGATVSTSQITAKVGWINKSASRNLTLYSSKDQSKGYKVDLGKKFSRKATPSLVEYIYLPIVD